MLKSSQEDIENLSLKQLMSAVTIKQVWAILGAFAAILIVAFSLGQHISHDKLMKAESDLKELNKEQQYQLARLQFFERAFEYYRNREIWQKSVGYKSTDGWSLKYPCSKEAISFVGAIEALRKTIDRLREFSDQSGIGIIDPRGVNLSKAGGEIQIQFSATGDTWTLPDHYHALNVDIGWASPCLC